MVLRIEECTLIVLKLIAVSIFHSSTKDGSYFIQHLPFLICHNCCYDVMKVESCQNVHWIVQLSWKAHKRDELDGFCIFFPVNIRID